MDIDDAAGFEDNPTITSTSTPQLLVQTTEHDGEEFVVMKPTVEGIGIAWSVQARKLAASKTLEVCKLKVDAGDMKSRRMLCIPFRRLPEWICGLNTSRMDMTLKRQILALQAQFQTVPGYLAANAADQDSMSSFHTRHDDGPSLST